MMLRYSPRCGDPGQRSLLRRSQTLFASILLLWCTAGCSRDPLRPQRGEPTPAPLGNVTTDVAPSWSHSGLLVAFHRRFPSIDGPAGVYLVDAAGGAPRFLAETGFTSPEFIRFSPNDQYLACDLDHQLLIVDLRSGGLSRPLFITNGLAEPNWSPDGSQIVYRRWASSMSMPPESMGVHIFTPASGVDAPLVAGGIVPGTFPVWSPDGKRLAIAQFTGDYYRIVLVNADGSGLHSLLDAPPNGALGGLRPHTHLLWGNGLVFGGQLTIGSGLFFVRWDGSALQKMPLEFRDGDAYSNDGRQGVGPRYAPSDSLSALFVFTTGDLTGASYRQITHFVPRTALAHTVLGRPAHPAHHALAGPGR